MGKRMERIIVIKSDETIVLAEYNGTESLNEAIQGDAECFLSTKLPVMAKLAEGKSSLPVKLYCKHDFSNDKEFNAIATLLSGKTVRGDAAMIVSSNDETRGFYYAIDIVNGEKRDGLSECWTAVDSVQLYTKFSRSKLDELNRKHSKISELSTGRGRQC